MGGFVPAQARQERCLLYNFPGDKRNFAPLVVSSLFAPSRAMGNMKIKCKPPQQLKQRLASIQRIQELLFKRIFDFKYRPQNFLATKIALKKGVD